MSGGGSGRIFALSKGQDKAVDPIDSVWLSAAAGTGKTQVLSARVLRLLLREDVAPEQILCLTFTKAGAAEMANRVNAVLAQWVRMPETQLGADLLAIGASNREDVRTRARSLFARVLDTPSGGLRINTIHAFSQWLLSAFPEEAGLTPGTQALEDRDRDPLAQATLSELLEEWQAGGDTDMLDALAALSMRFGPDGAQGWLMRCAQAGDLWLGAGGWPDDLRERLLRVLELADRPVGGNGSCGVRRRCIRYGGGAGLYSRAGNMGHQDGGEGDPAAAAMAGAVGAGAGGRARPVRRVAVYQGQLRQPRSGSGICDEYREEGAGLRCGCGARGGFAAHRAGGAAGAGAGGMAGACAARRAALCPAVGRSEAARGADGLRRPDQAGRQPAARHRHSLDTVQAGPRYRPYPARRSAGHQCRAMVHHQGAGGRLLRWGGAAGRAVAHALRGGRLQTGDLRVSGHQPRKLRRRKELFRSQDCPRRRQSARAG